MRRSPTEWQTAAAVVRLAKGELGGEWTSLEWRNIAQVAYRERCLTLSWLRSSATIRRYADPHVSTVWRDLALRALARGHVQIETLKTLTDQMRSAGVQSVVLKGAPLAAALYGEPGARNSADLDIWVSPKHREQVRRLLLRTGWQVADATATEDEAFSREGPHGLEYLELHFALLHRRFRYLSLPDPECGEQSVGSATLPVMSGPLVPAYFASHIARHDRAPLQWLIDLQTLWNRLDPDARDLARWTARECGLHRYLAWALRRTTIMDRAAQGERHAIARLNLRSDRRDWHQMWRHIVLAPSVAHSWRAVEAWLVPPWATVGGETTGQLAKRFRRHWRTALMRTADRRDHKGSVIASREVTVGGGEMLRVIRAIGAVGGCTWVTTTGTSMFPTLRTDDCVLLEPVTRLALGDVVLVDANGTPLLHRVVDLRGDRILTCGDARMTKDTPHRRDAIVARATRARRGVSEWSLEPTIWRRLRMRAQLGRQVVRREGRPAC